MSRMEVGHVEERDGFWAVLARSALHSADMMTGGIASHFDDAAEHRSLGVHDADAYARVERAMSRVRTDAARELMAGADKAAETQSQRLQPMGVADSFYMAHVDRAGPARTEPNAFQVAAASDTPRFARMSARDLTESSQEGVREIARRTVREAIAAIRAARRQVEGLGKFVDGAQLRALGDGAPDAFARVGRKMVELAVVAGVAATFVPHEAQAWGLRGNGPQAGSGAQAGQVQAQFPRPVMVRPQAPVVANRTANVYTGNRGGNGGYGNGGYADNGWVGRRPDAGRVAAGVAAGVIAGAVVGSALTNGYGAPYGGTAPYGGYGNQGTYGATYGGGYGNRGYAPSVPPGDKILMAARLVTMEMTGSVAAADRRVNDMAAQGAACMRAGAGSCVVNAPGIHFDYRAGVYGVSFQGRDVAVQNGGGYHEIDHALLARAFEDAAVIHGREASSGTNGYGQVPDRRTAQGYDAYGDQARQHTSRPLPGRAPTEGYWEQDQQGDWEQHVPAPGR